MPPDSSTTGPSGVSTGTYDTDNDEIYILKVKRLLRVFGEPITLFGETNAQRVERLKAIQLKRAEAYASFICIASEFHHLCYFQSEQGISYHVYVSLSDCSSPFSVPT